jgi:hypothetical protein
MRMKRRAVNLEQSIFGALLHVNCMLPVVLYRGNEDDTK